MQSFGLMLKTISLPRYVVNQVTAGDYDCPRKVLKFLTDLHTYSHLALKKSPMCDHETLPFMHSLKDKDQVKKKGATDTKKPATPYIMWCKDHWTRSRTKIQKQTSLKSQTFWGPNGRH